MSDRYPKISLTPEIIKASHCDRDAFIRVPPNTWVSLRLVDDDSTDDGFSALRGPKRD